jgi:hypothetical protein
MKSVKFWLLAIGALLVVVALAITGFTERKTKPVPGTPEYARAQKAAKAKRAAAEGLDTETETETETDDGDQIETA